MRTLLSRYIQCLRARKGFSVDFVSTQAQLSIVDYIQFEEDPQKIPLNKVARIFNSLLMNSNEFMDFQLISKIVTLPNYENKTKNSEELEFKLPLDERILSLRGKREILLKDELKSEDSEC